MGVIRCVLALGLAYPLVFCVDYVRRRIRNLDNSRGQQPFQTPVDSAGEGEVLF